MYAFIFANNAKCFFSRVIGAAVREGDNQQHKYNYIETLLCIVMMPWESTGRGGISKLILAQMWS